MITRKERILGMLIGLHIGDSLGANLEFKDARPLDNLQVDIIGGGDLNWEPGEPTDDTLMMLMVLESIAKEKKVNIFDIGDRFLSWLKTCPKDIGGTVRQALEKIQRGESPEVSGITKEYSQGNGSLMRCAPLAILDVNDDDIRSQCAITHGHINCIVSDQIFILSLKQALNGEDKQAIFDSACSTARGKSCEHYNIFNKVIVQSWEELSCDGFVIDTLAHAYWGLINTRSFEDALVKIVNRGGDADTVGAVAGALCGAYYGVNAIPDRWINKIQMRKPIEQLVADCEIVKSED